MTLTVACTVDSLPEGAIKKFAVLGKDILLVKKDGQIYAMDDLCTHNGEDLVKGYLERINEMTRLFVLVMELSSKSLVVESCVLQRMG